MSVTLIVDGANVMGSRADGWWRDRPGAMARLHGELAALATRGIAGPVPGEPQAGETGGSEPEAGGPGGPEAGDRWFPDIVLVVEGRACKVLDLVEPAPGVEVVPARGEGDHAIAALAEQLPGQRVVITADRELRRRCEAAGAAVLGPRWLMGLLGPKTQS
jgi:8-oxo-dGTP diphosphatase